MGAPVTIVCAAQLDSLEDANNCQLERQCLVLFSVYAPWKAVLLLLKMISTEISSDYFKAFGQRSLWSFLVIIDCFGESRFADPFD